MYQQYVHLPIEHFLHLSCIRYVKYHLQWLDYVHDWAKALISSTFQDDPSLKVHLRKVSDNLHKSVQLHHSLPPVDYPSIHMVHGHPWLPSSMNSQSLYRVVLELLQHSNPVSLFCLPVLNATSLLHPLYSQLP